MSPDNAGNLEVVIEECVFQLFDEAESEIYVRLYNANDILRLKGNHLLLMSYRYRRIQMMKIFVSPSGHNLATVGEFCGTECDSYYTNL
ncbi:hypothetical protein CEXT_549001 [Caerostris extrusa]|uniref:Uncharacterized protein n=1 Tax=Caerostris extrusa TaxID=172846 RepID=A0AAV4XSD3_CAEEX|nr:hypothetical protein CEXT_549001 [Caerostris extrusa]